jgi:type I restriction enzyme S subunit
MIYRFDDIAYNITTKRVPTPDDKATYIGLEHLDSGELYVKRYGSDVDLKGDKLVMTKGDILFGKRNTYLKRVAIAPFDGLFSAHGMIFHPKEDVIDRRYFPFFINSDAFMDEAIRISVGSLSPTVNWKDLKDLEFDIPPIEEQKKLADKLWAAYDLKSKYANLIESIDEMVKSQFIEMFDSMETTPVGEYIQDSYPGEWGVDDTDGTGIKVIRTTNFTNSGKLDLSNVVTRDIEEKKVNRKRIQKYDTILERSGGTTDNPVGRVVLFEEDDNYLCNNFTQVLRFKDVDPRFAFYSLYYFYQTNKTAIRGMGNKTTGIQNLNMGKYLEIGIPNASSAQQKSFVAIAEQADKSKFELKKSIEKIDNVIKALMQ